MAQTAAIAGRSITSTRGRLADLKADLARRVRGERDTAEAKLADAGQCTSRGLYFVFRVGTPSAKSASMPSHRIRFPWNLYGLLRDRVIMFCRSEPCFSSSLPAPA